MKRISYNHKILWKYNIDETDEDFYYTEVVTLVSIVLVNDEYIRVNLNFIDLTGCCNERKTIHIYPVRL